MSQAIEESLRRRGIHFVCHMTPCDRLPSIFSHGGLLSGAERERRGIPEGEHPHYWGSARAQGAFYGKHLRHGDPFIALRAGRDLLRGPWLLLRAIVAQNPDLRMLGRAELAGILPGIIAGLRMPGPP